MARQVQIIEAKELDQAAMQCLQADIGHIPMRVEGAGNFKIEIAIDVQTVVLQTESGEGKR